MSNEQDTDFHMRYKLSHEPQINQSVQLVNLNTNAASGKLIPTTKKAINNLKNIIKKQTLDLNISPDSQVIFANKLPSGSVENNSILNLDDDATATDIKLNNSVINLNHQNMLKRSSFTHVKTLSINTPDHQIKIKDSSLYHTNLLDGCDINDSIIDYAVISDSNIQHSSLKGGNYVNDTITSSLTWLNRPSVIDGTKLTNSRLENWRMNMDYYHETEPAMAKDLHSIYDSHNIDKALKLSFNFPTIIGHSTLDNVQILRNERSGSTIDKSHLANTFVNEWLIADQSSVGSQDSTKPLLIGKVSLDHNKINLTKSAVSYNLDIYSSDEAQTGLSLNKNQELNDTNIKNDKHAIILNPKAKSYQVLAELTAKQSHAVNNNHYPLVDGKQLLDALTNVISDDGGRNIQIPTESTEIEGPEP